MTREEAIYQLMGLMPSKEKIVNSWTKEHLEALSMAIRALENNPWHKASEELPEVPEKKKYVKVLTTLPHGSGYDFRILYFHKDFGFSKHKEYQNAYYKDRKNRMRSLDVYPGNQGRLNYGGTSNT